MGEGEGDTTFHARSIVGERDIYPFFSFHSLYLYFSPLTRSGWDCLYTGGGFGANRYITAA